MITESVKQSSVFKSAYRQLDLPGRNESPALLISFFGGKPYYGACAERLAGQCRDFGIEHDICEIETDNKNWLNICREKVNFYTSKLSEHRRAVFWIDVDSQIISDPTSALRSEADVSGFLRNFRYIVGFDPQQFSRLIHPGYLRIGHTEKGLAFAQALRTASKAAPDNATDDYVLEQTLRDFDRLLRFDFLPPDLIVASNESGGRANAVFQHSDSGNVSAQQKNARQHEASALTVERQKRVLVKAATDCLIRGERQNAAVFFRQVRRIDPDDKENLVKLLSIYEQEGNQGAYRYHMEQARKSPVLRPTVLRIDTERRMKSGDWDRVKQGLAELQQMEATDELDLLASRQVRHDLNRRAQEAGVSDDDRVSMWWWEQPYPGNLGDMINPYIVEGLSGAPPRFSSSSPRVLAIGSIIKFARKGDSVWGAGASATTTLIVPDVSFHAVRGPLTRDLVLRAGGQCPPVYGDAAWFLPHLYRPTLDGPRARVGLIRHFTHLAAPVTLGEGVAEISILREGYAGIEAFIDEILGCEAILSSSLHGVIIANAYGIPAKWCTFSSSARQIHGDGMKFDDYFRSVGRRDMNPLDLSSLDRIDGTLARVCTDNPDHAPDLDAMTASAPFRVQEDNHRLN